MTATATPTNDDNRDAGFQDFTIHPICECWPALTGDDFEKLKRDIEEHGVRSPLVLAPDGQVLDGQNRLRAAQAVGRECPTIEYSGDTSDKALAAFTRSLNETRRHMTPSQRAAQAAKLSALLSLRQNLRRRPVEGNEPSTPRGRGRPTKRQQSVAALAEQANVGKRIMTNAIRVQETSPRLNDEVLAGDKTVSQALDEIDNPGAEAIHKPTVEERMAAWSTAIETFARSVTALARGAPQGPWVDENRLAILESQLRAAAGTMRAIKGHGTCPYCTGDGCKRCRDTGFLPRADYDSSSARPLKAA